MISRSRRVATAFAGAALAAGVGMASTASAGAGRVSTFHGVFTETTKGSDLGYDIRGSAKMAVSSAGTAVTVHVAGLDPKIYGSHLHNGTCASGGGGHYQDVAGPLITPPNELWLHAIGSGLVPNAGGVAHGSGSATWQARVSSTVLTNALSVVVHEPGGARIACADLG